MSNYVLRIFHYSPLIYFYRPSAEHLPVENLSLFAFDILPSPASATEAS